MNEPVATDTPVEPTAADARWSEARIHEALLDAGLPLPELDAVVLAIPQPAAAIVSLRRLAPKLRAIVVLSSTASDLPLVGATSLVIGDADTQRDDGLALLETLLRAGVRAARVAWIDDPDADDGDVATALVRALGWRGLEPWLDTMVQLDARAHTVLGAWAERLEAEQSSLAALRLWLLLYAHTRSPAIATRVAIAYDKLGAPQHAARWLPRADAPPAAIDELVAQARADAAVQAQAEQAQRDANLAALRERWPAAAEALAAASRSGLDILCTDALPWRWSSAAGVRRDPYPLVVSIDDDGMRERVRVHAHPESPARLRAQMTARVGAAGRHAMVGLADWAAVLNLVGNRVTTTLPGWTQQVYGFADDTAVLRRLLGAIDLRAVLASGVFAAVFVGDDATSQALRFFASERLRPVPRIRVGCDAIDPALARLDRERIEGWHRTTAALAHHHRDTAARALAKLDAGAPLRVWLWSSIHTTVLRHVGAGLMAGFDALGHTPQLQIEHDPRDNYDLPAVADALAAFDADLAIQLDHIRPEYGPLLAPGLPVAAWVLDELPPLSDPALVAKLGALDLTFAWSAPLARAYAERGHPHSAKLLFAVDPATYHARDALPAEDAIAYATHLTLPFEPRWAPGIYAELERVLQTMPQLPSGLVELAPVIERLLARTGVIVPEPLASTFAYDALLVARHVERTRVADEILAAGLPLRLYGRGWNRIERFAAHAHGEIAAGPDLRAMYQRHKVVLHINTRCNLHPRVLEAAASGGFVLARSDGDFDWADGGVHDALEIGRELCLFDDPADMLAKLRRALVDEPWRREFAQAAHDRVHADHTYVQRARTIIDALHARLRAVAGDPTTHDPA